jgi:hypothetical protein
MNLPSRRDLLRTVLEIDDHTVIESGDGRTDIALTELALQWTDLMEMNIVPVVEDKEFGDVLKGPAIRRSSKREKISDG